MKTVETQVFIVGSGPTGLSAALFLARSGIEVLVVTRAPWTADSPRAHITNQRTMEIMRAVGLQEACWSKASSRQYIQHTIWAGSFAGEELGRIYSWGNDPARLSDYMLASPMELCDLPQTYFEPILLTEAARLGARIRFENVLLDFEQSDTEVLATVLDNATSEKFQVRAKYLIGADGGRSLVAEKLVLPMVGSAGLDSAINVVFGADLTRFVAHRPMSIFYVIQPPRDGWSGLGIVRMVRPWNEWMAIFSVAGGFEGKTLDAKTFEEPIRHMIGDDTIPFDIKAISRWQVNHVVAKSYSKGRVICAGDAVHRHPPMNGLGSNTCIQDSFNFSWKLGLILKGLAAPSLIDTYSIERQPVGQRVVDRAIESFHENKRVLEALGVHPSQTAAERATALAELKAPTVEGGRRRQKWRSMLQQKHTTFNALGMELNQIYADGAIVSDGATPPVFDRNLDLYYEATTMPGARLPHCWLERGRARISTLDLTSPERFTLITGPRGRHWQDATSTVHARLGIQIECVEIGVGSEVSDVYGDWARISEIDEDGCILVRPDMHIAWRSKSQAADIERELLGVLNTILGHPIRERPSA